MNAYAQAPALPDSEAESLHEHVTLKQAASELLRRRAGRKTHVATLYRWTNVGCRGVKLRFVMVGATRCTTRAWLAEFFDALTRKATGEPDNPPVRSTAARQRDVAKADRELAELGI